MTYIDTQSGIRNQDSSVEAVEDIAHHRRSGYCDCKEIKLKSCITIHHLMLNHSQQLSEIWGYSSHAVDCSILDCDTVWSCGLLKTFRWHVSAPSSGWRKFISIQLCLFDVWNFYAILLKILEDIRPVSDYGQSLPTPTPTEYIWNYFGMYCFDTCN